MKNVRIATILVITFISLTALACTDSKKEQENTQDSHSEMNNDMKSVSNDTMNADTQNTSDAQQVLKDYMALKDALVATDEAAASKAGKKLESTLKGFNVSSYTAAQQKELKDIIEVATEHAEHIGRSDIGHQREHFKMLSKDIIDMVAITGTESTLYQQFCPMYDKGSAWLSLEEDIKNPYYGSKMMNCGKVQKEITK